MWHRHGRVWGHLVSDTSLAELHDFAARAGIPRRGFDLDHYDVPAERYEHLLTLGAELVDGRVLVRRLRASGLRVPARDRRPPDRDPIDPPRDPDGPTARRAGGPAHGPGGPAPGRSAR